jgi:hypothetical protein
MGDSDDGGSRVWTCVSPSQFDVRFEAGVRAKVKEAAKIEGGSGLAGEYLHTFFPFLPTAPLS